MKQLAGPAFSACLALTAPAIALGVVAPVAAVAQAGPGSNAALRACTEAEFQAALRGDYDGEPCRYAPDAPDSPAAQAQLAGGPAAPAARPVPAVHSVAPPARPTTPPPPSRPIYQAPRTAQTVTLDESFFTGPQAGGVGRDPRQHAGWYYGYRGVILIDASGRSHVSDDVARRSGRIVRRMDGTAHDYVRRSRFQRR